MSWIQKLCDVYDSVIDTAGAEGDGALLPVGFILKPIKFNIILSPEGEFSSVQVIPDTEQICPSQAPPRPRAAQETTVRPSRWQISSNICCVTAKRKIRVLKNICSSSPDGALSRTLRSACACCTAISKRKRCTPI